MSEVVVTQLPVSAVPSPSRTEIEDTMNAMCMVAAFSDGLTIEIPPEPAKITPKSKGNKAVT